MGQGKFKGSKIRGGGKMPKRKKPPKIRPKKGEKRGIDIRSKMKRGIA